MLSWVRLRGINAHSVSPPARKLAGTNFTYCLVNRDVRALVASPDPLVRKLVDSGIESATLQSTGRTLDHTTTGFINYIPTAAYLLLYISLENKFSYSFSMKSITWVLQKKLN